MVIFLLFTTLQLRVGALGRRLHAGYVRSGGPAVGYLRRRIPQLRVLLPVHGAHDRELPQRWSDGYAFCQYEVSLLNDTFWEKT